MFTRAIVKRPCRNMINGISTAGLGTPDYQLALRQHDAYIEALALCGLDVTVLSADEDFPDSVFIEDTALVTPRCAVITCPGAQSRRGETESTVEALKKFQLIIEQIVEPGTLDAGDVMMAGDHYFIGLSGRSSAEGARQLTEILERYDLSASTVKLKEILHLKTGVVYLDNEVMVGSDEFVKRPEFSSFKRIVVDWAERYAANCVWINGWVLVADGYPVIRRKLEAAGYETIALDMSEFRKLDGGLSCLSLRF